MYVSVHMIAKETTKFGHMLMAAALQSLSFFPDQIVFVDNGCSEINADIFDAVGPLDDFTCVRMEGDFSKLRQAAIENTSSRATHCFIVDTDEIFFEGNLKIVRKNLEKIGDKPSYGTFKHFVESPSYMQDVLKRNNVFSKNKDVKWWNGVHEDLSIFKEEKVVANGGDWMHCGYLRSTVATAIKWLHYDMIEFGDVNRYKINESLMFRLGIDKVLCDRKKEYIVYEERYPECFYPILREYEKSDSLNWQHWVTYVVDPRYGKLLDEFKKMVGSGNWGVAIDYIVENKLWNEY